MDAGGETEPGGRTVMFSLEDAESSLAYSINNNASMIYFHHGSQSFMYFIGSDIALYRQEMRTLSRGICQGRISAITAGEPLNIKGTDLFPMDVKIDNAPCHPYMLLRRRGRLEDADNSPYFFKSQQKRDEVVAFLIGKLQAKG